MSPRRNDACPCGSGRKYKVCCGPNVLAGSAWTNAEVQLALEAIQSFAERREFGLPCRAWVARLWSAAPEGIGPELFGRSELSNFIQLSLRYSFCLESRLADGSRPIELLLERKPKKLSSRVSSCIEALSRTRVDLYRVTRADAGSISVAGTRSPDEVEVERISDSDDDEGPPVGAWIACRVVRAPHSKGHIVGETLPFPMDFDAQALRAALVVDGELETRGSAEREEGVAQLVLTAFLEAHLEAALAQTSTSKGATFEVLETAQLVRTLDDCDGLVRDPSGNWEWFGDDAPDDGLPLASFVLVGDLFEVIVYEDEDLETVLRLVDELVGELLRSADDDDEDEGDAEEEENDEEGSSTPLGLRDVELVPARSVAQLLRIASSTFRDWAESPLGGLGGRSMREAAADAASRDEVERLLELAATLVEERDESALRWMRDELGLV